MITTLLYLLIVAIILGTIVWVAGQIPGVAPFARIIQVIVMVIFVVYVIWILIGMLGGIPHPLIK